MHFVADIPYASHNHRTLLRCTLLLGSLLVLAVLSPLPAKAQSPGEPLTPVVLQLRWFHQFQFAGYYAAKAKGFYQEAGLDVGIQERDDNQDPITEVLEGRAQFGVANSEVLVQALRGKPVSVLAAIFQHSPLTLLVRAGSGLTTPHDLVGRRVKMSRHIRDVELQAMFLNEGMTLSQLELTDGEAGKKDYLDPSLDALAAYVTNQPYYLEQLGIKYSLIQPRRYGIDFYGDCLFTSNEMIDHRHAEVLAFTRASIKGWEYAMAHPQEIIDLILAKYSDKKPRKHLEFEAKELKQLILPDMIQIGHMNPGRWRHMAETFVQLGLAPAERMTDAFFDHFVHSPLDHAKIHTLNEKVQLLWRTIFIVAGLAVALLLITRRMRKEINRRKTMEQALKKSEGFHRTLFENTGTCTVVAERNGTITMANRQSESLFKMTKDEIVNHYKWQDFVHPEDLAKMTAINKNRQEGKEAPTDYEFRFIDGKGETRNVHVTVEKLPYNMQIICSLNDITPRIQAEQEREEIIDELENKNEELERFAYTVSHDLKSPLITIKGFLGLMNEAIEEGNTDLVQECLKRINRASDTMLNLLDELLNLSRIGRVGGTPKPSSLSALAHEAAHNVKGILDQTGTIVSISPDLPTVLCDPMRIREVFQNMFENAARYGAPEGNTLVEVSHRTEETELGTETVYVVRDTGMGINPQYTERIFRIFEQLNPGEGGTGIGLALVRRIIEHHGGRVWAESKGLGAGTAFCFTLETPKTGH